MARTYGQSTKGIRFAPLIRVSTKRQQKGESPEVQKKNIKDAVDTMGGVVSTWKYCGQEHAMEGFDRQLLKNLLEDAEKIPRLFDAVIVDDLDRWSRDNEKSTPGLKIFRKNDIRFFELKREYDLWDEDDFYDIAHATLMAEREVKKRNRKSIASKIKGANEEGKPTCGKLPFGRDYNGRKHKDKSKVGWTIFEPEAKIIRYTAKEYLKEGGSIQKIARTVGKNAAYLWRVLTELSGPIWLQEFTRRDGTVETIQTKVPELLPKPTIDKIMQRKELNKTYHGKPKHRYLLSKMIFCSECGYAMFGQANHNNKLYYRHAHSERRKSCNADINSIPANEIEEAVIVELFKMWGDPKATAQAIEAAFPKAAEVPNIEESLNHFNNELAKITTEKGRIVSAIGKGSIFPDEAEIQLTPLRDREAALKESIASLQHKLSGIPSKKEIESRAWRLSKMAQKVLRRAIERGYKSAEHYDRMSWENKRSLIEAALGGKDAEGHRYGVYIKKGKSDVKWIFTIRGLLPEDYFVSIKGEVVTVKTVTGSLPMSKQRKNEILERFDPETDLAGDLIKSSLS